MTITALRALLEDLERRGLGALPACYVNHEDYVTNVDFVEHRTRGREIAAPGGSEPTEYVLLA
jgi:hypothetical protein